MRIDLHTHSRVSDGTQSPRELVRAAADAGLDVLALTDHDTAAGWAEAAAEAEQVGVELVRGMEVSTTYRGRSVHLLAYLPDPTHPELVTRLQQVLRGRASRVPLIVARLRELGADITVDDVLAVSDGTAAPGRPHIADALVRAGVVADRTEGFERFLRAGAPAFVSRPAAELFGTVAAVEQAGGVSVVAHPWGRSAHGVLVAETFARLAEAGLSGIEVDHEDHGPAQRRELRAIAADLDLVVTGSSDHHGEGKVDHPLGCNTTAPEEYVRLLAAAERAAARSGRRTPRVVSPA